MKLEKFRLNFSRCTNCYVAPLKTKIANVGSAYYKGVLMERGH